MGIINAFRHHTSYHSDEDVFLSVDYTGRGGEFIAWVGGHWHKDIIADIEGVMCLAVAQDCAQTAERSKGEITEHAFEILTIDRKSHKVYATRIGFGADRELEYEVF